MKISSTVSFLVIIFSVMFLMSCDHRSLEELISTAEVYEAKGDYQMANVVYDEMMRDYPEYDGSYVQKGINLARNNEQSQAIRVFKKGLRRIPESLYLHYNLAIAYSNKEQLDSAIVHFTSALTFSKKCEPVSNRPQLVFVTTNEEETIESSEIFFERGLCYFDQDKLEECASDMRECIRCGYDLGSSHYMLGLCLYKLGSEQLGCEEMHKSLQCGDERAREYIDSNCDHVYNNN
jgi:tetratricopeptide (TPR) repeat protein